jgi:hypothetical protein
MVIIFILHDTFSLTLILNKAFIRSTVLNRVMLIISQHLLAKLHLKNK